MSTPRQECQLLISLLNSLKVLVNEDDGEEVNCSVNQKERHETKRATDLDTKRFSNNESFQKFSLKH
jgi:hypothetical protein